jgi:hypothetical protein
MNSDRLEQLTRALREEGNRTTPAEVRATRARVMTSLRGGDRRTRRFVMLVVPIAAVLVASAALAKSGVPVGKAWDWITVEIGGGPPRGPAPSKAAPKPRSAPSSARPPSRTDDDIAPPASAAPARIPTPPADSAPPAAVPPVAAPIARAPASARAAGAPRPAASEDAESAALALYREAHRLQFTDRDYAAALRAWDGYIQAAPRGPLVIEARYNRAIALVHLGRTAEARAALAPFARGDVGGGYHQRETSELLDALDAAP